MQWENESTRPSCLEPINAMEIAYDAYCEGFIKWNAYQEVMGRIKTNMNGTWMFEKNTEDNNNGN